MWKGELQSTIDLDTISNKAGLIGIGPEAFLKGEIMILDGKAYVSRVADSNRMEVTESFQVGAPFFVYANVSQWKSVQLNSNIIGIKDLEEFLKSSIVDQSKAFAFKIKGSINSATIHAQNLPEGTKVSSPKEAHQGQVNYNLNETEVEIAGFYSTQHQAVFTHHDAYTHMHLITSDKSMMGHLDKVDFKEVELFLPDHVEINVVERKEGVKLKVLGTIQDAGSPHIGCKKDCCKELFENPDIDRKVVALGLLDHDNQKKYLFEASPDLATQLKDLKFNTEDKEMPDGIFLTHAHIGHYSGLMYLGKEAIDARSVQVYTMPRMKKFLTNDGPWSQLVERENIELLGLYADSAIVLSSNLSVTPFLVPHRDEYSETVGYFIEGPSKKALFIPDIDKWQKWDRSIVDLIKKVDYAFVDATFFSGEEIGHRDISQIPHPFVIESMELFDQLPLEEKLKINFIHLNHTNPLILKDSPESKEVESKGYKIARRGQIFTL